MRSDSHWGFIVTNTAKSCATRQCDLILHSTTTDIRNHVHHTKESTRIEQTWLRKCSLRNWSVAVHRFWGTIFQSFVFQDREPAVKKEDNNLTCSQTLSNSPREQLLECTTIQWVYWMLHTKTIKYELAMLYKPIWDIWRLRKSLYGRNLLKA